VAAKAHNQRHAAEAVAVLDGVTAAHAELDRSLCAAGGVLEILAHEDQHGRQAVLGVGPCAHIGARLR
jgi:hypothetical protein